MKKMNSKGFTLIEMLGVIVILGLLMTIAITNTLSMIDKNKKTSYIEDAKSFVALAQSKMQADKKLDMPVDDTTALVLTLGDLHTSDIIKSPYSEEYDKDLSFVAVIFNGSKYEYYVHLISCTGNGACDARTDSAWRGINLIEVSKLNEDNRFDYVKSSGVHANTINELESIGTLGGRSIDRASL